MTDMILTPWTQWPDGAPKTLVDGRPDALLHREDTDYVIVASGGVEEAFPGGAMDLAVDLGHFNPPSSAGEFAAAWYARAPGLDMPWERAPRSAAPLVARTLATVPSGVVVFTRVSGIWPPTTTETRTMPSGEAYGYAELPNVPMSYVNAAGVRLWTLPGESLSLASPGRPLSDEQRVRNELIRRGRKRVSRWVPARVGGTAAVPGIFGPGGVFLAYTNRSSLLSVGATPPRATTLQLASVTGGLPWFRSDDPLDARLGLLAGAAFGTVYSNLGSVGVFAVESDPSSATAPWYVMPLRL